jgi:hypothetical protein
VHGAKWKTATASTETFVLPSTFKPSLGSRVLSTVLGTRQPRIGAFRPRPGPDPTSLAEQVSAARIMSDLRKLPPFRSSLDPSSNLAKAKAMVADSFRESGWEVREVPYELKNAEVRQDFGNYDRVTVPRLQGSNILAIKPGVGDGRRAILVGAHLDTVRVAPGANDNGAGVAGLTELARVLGKAHYRDTIILAAFDGEELGLVGSRQIAPELAKTYDIQGAIIYDVIGATNHAPGTQRVPAKFDVLYPYQGSRIAKNDSRGDFQAILDNGRSKGLAKTLGAAFMQVSGGSVPLVLRDPTDRPIIGPLLKRFIPTTRNLARSDHVAFQSLGVPAVHVTDTADLRSPRYHEASDDIAGIDPTRVANVVSATAMTVAREAELRDAKQ